jgi:hypothetical protein
MFLPAKEGKALRICTVKNLLKKGAPMEEMEVVEVMFI